MKKMLAVAMLFFALPLLAQEGTVPFTLELLQAELLNDPSGLGYAPLIVAHDYTGLADAVNLPRAAIVMRRPDIAPLEILEAIAVQDFISNANSLGAVWLQSLLAYPSIRILKDNGSDTRVMSNILRLLTNGSGSETRIRELASRPGSRAEQLWGMGFTVTREQVAGALGTY